MKNAIIHGKSKENKNWSLSNIFRKLVNCQEMTGQRVMKSEVNMGGNVNMEQISRGVYLYQISVEGKIKRGKLIKK